MVMLHIVQCFFKVIFEGIKTVENSVVKFLFPQIVPDVLHRVKLRRIWRKAEQSYIIRDFERFAFMPSGTVKYHDDPAFKIPGASSLRKYLHPSSFNSGHIS